VNRQRIFQTAFSDLEAPLIRLTDSRLGFFAITDDAGAVDKLTSPKAQDAFKKINLQPLVPPDLRAKRSVFVRQIDRFVGEKPALEIQEEIQRIQPWLKISEVVKIRDYTHVLKLVTTDTTITQRVLRDGFLMFNTKITPQQCQPEKFIHLLICYKCYKIEDHPTHQCTADVSVCSECGERGHIYTQCINTQKKCLNCDGNHRTLAASCPIRKKAITDKEQRLVRQEQDKEQRTYSQIAKTAIQESLVPKHSLTLTNNIQIKLLALILEAHIASMSGEVGFGTLLSDSLKLNYDIDAKFVDRDSKAIFNFFYKTNTNESFHMETEHQISSSDTEPESENESSNEQDTDMREALSVRPKERKLVSQQEEYQTQPRQPVEEEIFQTAGKILDLEPSTDSSLKRKISDQYRLTYDEKEQTETRPISIQIYRSANDKHPIPQNPNQNWYIEELNKKDFGLKFTVQDIDSKKTLEMIKSERLKLKGTKIHYLNHEKFQRLPKHSTTKTAKKSKP
jgi:hypothetical protein